MVDFSNFSFRKIGLILLSLILVIVALWLFFKKNDHKDKASQQIKVVEVKKIVPENIHQSLNLLGTIKAKYQADFVAQASGILNILSNPGNILEKNKIIAKIIDNQIEEKVTAASASEVIAKDDFERSKKLFEKGAFSKAQMEEKKKLWLHASRELSDVKNLFEKLQIIAPFKGEVGHFFFSEGSFVKQGERIVSFYNSDELYVELDLPKSIIPLVSEQTEAIINNQKYHLNFVPKLLDEQKFMTNAKVNIACKTCIIGDKTDVTLNINAKTKQVVVPFSSIFIKNQLPFIYVVEKNHVVAKQVILGIRKENEVQIISGISFDDLIVTKAPERLYDGIEVSYK